MERIYVAVRVRPLINQEVVKGNYWRVDDNRISLHNALGTPISGYSYTFDHVFGYNSKNADIYEVHTKDVIEAAVNGFNGTVFAYGQTSSGKTYTMQGSQEDLGIIRLSVYNVFKNIQSISDREFLIRVSYLEIYNEEINDLLAPENKKLQVHENLERGIFVAGLREEIVNTPDQVFDLIGLGEAHRHVGETNMNVRSSRSHTIFRMVIESRDKDAELDGSSYNKDTVRVSVLNLVDLAGSERVAKTGAGGVRLKEGTHINKSLMSLGTVINKLSDGGGKQRGHIPYRDSKLTRILQPALGGNAKTAIICTIAPEEVHADETRGTLQFASRAKRVTNCAQVNEIMTDAALLKRQKREIEELRKKLQGSHSEDLELEILKLRNEMLKFELEREKLAAELEEERKSQLERDRRIMEQQLKIDNLSTLVINSDQDRNSFKLNSCERTYPRRLSLEFLGQERRSTGNGCREGSLDSRITLRKEKFRSPSFGTGLDGSAEKLRSIPRYPDASPPPSNFGNIADEDMWMTMNKGHINTDLDYLQCTPNGNCSSVPSEISSVHGAVEGCREEIECLRQQLEKALQDKQEIEKCLDDQTILNEELKMIVSQLESETSLIMNISQRLGRAILDFKDDQRGLSSYLQGIFLEEKSMNDMQLPPEDDSSNCRIVNLKSNFVKLVNLLEQYKQENSELHRQNQMLNKQLKHAVVSLVMPRDVCSENERRKLQNFDLDKQISSTSTVLQVPDYCDFGTSFSLSADTSSRIVSAPLNESFKQICHKIYRLENVLGVSAAIDVGSLCANIGDGLSSFYPDGSSVSKSIPDFIGEMQYKQADQLEDGNSDISIGCHESNIWNEELFKNGPKSASDSHIDKRKSAKMSSDLANGVFLAKWLVEELKNLAQHGHDFLSGRKEMSPCIEKLFEALHVCLNEIVKFDSGLGQSSCEEDNLCRCVKSDMTSHLNNDESQKGLAVPDGSVDVELNTNKVLIEKGQHPVDGMSNLMKWKGEHKLQQQEYMNLWERLNMSAEHILSLDNKIALLNIEKDTISKALDNELQRQEQKQLDTTFYELVADELKRFSAAMAARDGIYTSIRCAIKEFEEDFQKKRPSKSVA